MDLLERKRGVLGIESKKILAAAVSLAIIILLVLSGPVGALTLNLGVERDNIDRGEKVKMTGSIDVRDDERIDFNDIKLVINGSTNRVCYFDINGSIISGCEGITIRKISNNSKGYGYGYSYGYSYGYGYNNGYSNEIFSYEIEIDSLNAGTYNVKLETVLGERVYNSGTKEIHVNEVVRTEGAIGDGSCYSDWRCLEWSSCANGVQRRTCTQITSWCVAKEKPIEERACGIGGNANEEGLNETENVSEDAGRNAGITAAVVGALGNARNLILIVVFVLAVVGGFIGIRMVRRKKGIKKIKRAVVYENTFAEN